MIFGISLNDFYDIGKQRVGKQDPGFVLGTSYRHLHGFCSSSGTIIQRSIADIKSGKFAHHALILENIPQCTLRDFSLIWCISSKEFGTRCDIRDYRGSIVVISPGTDEYFQTSILLGQSFEIISDFLFALGIRKVILTLEDEIGRHVVVQIVE